MQQVKLFRTQLDKIEEKLNNWLKKEQTVTIKYVSTAVQGSGVTEEIIVLVVYELR